MFLICHRILLIYLIVYIRKIRKEKKKIEFNPKFNELKKLKMIISSFNKYFFIIFIYYIINHSLRYYF